MSPGPAASTRDDHGFTLIDVLIVMMAPGVLATIVLCSVGSTLARRCPEQLCDRGKGDHRDGGGGDGHREVAVKLLQPAGSIVTVAVAIGRWAVPGHDDYFRIGGAGNASMGPGPPAWAGWVAPVQPSASGLG